jgi:hypothetical protein
MSPPFEEYIGKLLAVVVSLRVFTIRFILYKCPIEDSEGLSFIVKIFNRVPHPKCLISRILRVGVVHKYMRAISHSLHSSVVQRFAEAGIKMGHQTGPQYQGALDVCALSDTCLMSGPGNVSRDPGGDYIRSRSDAGSRAATR